MPRREYRLTFECAEPGCKEMQFLVHTLRRDQETAWQWQQKHPYRCTRHASPERNLRPGNESAGIILTAVRVPMRGYPGEDTGEFLKGLYWQPEGGRPGSRFVFGEGFNAHASDFPEGTRLEITARILPPLADGEGAGNG